MSDADHRIALWRQLQATAGVLAAVRRGVSGTAAMEDVPPVLRPGVQALSYQVLRALGRAEALRRLLAPRKPLAAIDALLCSALALAWDEGQAPYESHTLVNQAVEAAKRSPELRGQAGFVNGCLRRFLRERAALVARTAADAVACWNHPAWWIERLQHDYPQNWQAILAANNQQAPMTLRVNRRRSSVEAYLQWLRGAGLDAWRNGAHGVTLTRPLPVQAIPGFADGVVSVQDAAAQLAAPLLLGPQAPPGLRVLDACAAPGGKTAHLLERQPKLAGVVAVDADENRLKRVQENLDRIGLTAKVIHGDASTPDLWWPEGQFDRILLDAPCSATGVIRRHPDIKWLRRDQDIRELAELQHRILGALWSKLKSGGTLLYATCSVLPEENRDQIRAFLAATPDATLVPLHAQDTPEYPGRQFLPGEAEMDGFYYAKLIKR